MGKVENKGQNEVSLSGLMKELSIPLNKENAEVIRFFLKENFPISKDILQQTVSLLKESNINQAGLEAIKYLVMNELPLTKTTFQAVTEVINKDSLTQNLQALQDAIVEKSFNKRRKSIT